MKLEKAIEIGHIIVQTGEYEGDPDDSDAVKLGIEALKFYRESSHFACGRLLPGQTGETDD